jgi:hypothetical protein
MRGRIWTPPERDLIPLSSARGGFICRALPIFMLEVLPKAMNARAVLSRMEIRAPYTGRVVGLSVFSVGGVIQRGEKILDIVPDEDSLTIEAQKVAVEDISDVHPNTRAEVHLTAYKQRIVPIIHGDVIQVSEAAKRTYPSTCGPMCLPMNLTISEKRTPPVSRGRSFRTNVAYGITTGAMKRPTGAERGLQVRLSPASTTTASAKEKRPRT